MTCNCARLQLFLQYPQKKLVSRWFRFWKLLYQLFVCVFLCKEFYSFLLSIIVSKLQIRHETGLMSGVEYLLWSLFIQNDFNQFFLWIKVVELLDIFNIEQNLFLNLLDRLSLLLLLGGEGIFQFTLLAEPWHCILCSRGILFEYLFVRKKLVRIFIEIYMQNNNLKGFIINFYLLNWRFLFCKIRILIFLIH